MTAVHERSTSGLPCHGVSGVEEQGPVPTANRWLPPPARRNGRPFGPSAGGGCRPPGPRPGAFSPGACRSGSREVGRRAWPGPGPWRSAVPAFRLPGRRSFRAFWMSTWSRISQAAATGSTKTASSSETESGTGWRFCSGRVKYSRKAPSRFRIPSTERWGQCLPQPDRQNSHRRQAALISPTTRAPTRDGVLEDSTLPTNSWPSTPLNPKYPRVISRSVLHIPAWIRRTTLSSPVKTGLGRVYDFKLPIKNNRLHDRSGVRMG